MPENREALPRQRTCEAHTRTGKLCGKRARFAYQVVAGRVEYLCGQHVGPFARESRFLKELPRAS